jgi:prevent-host-death family protein
MKMITSRELNIHTARVLRSARKDDLIVTLKGKPIALIQGFSQDELEDYVLGKLMEKRLKQRPKDYRSEDAVSFDAMIAATDREFAR